MNLRTIPLVAALALSGCATVPATTTRAASSASAPAPATENAEHHRAPAPEPPPVAVDPGTANLDPDLLAAVRAATKDAAADGVRISITSGWRSREHQQRLLDEAVARYGSLSEALRYVSTPDQSAHVSGHAVDIGPEEADAWLSQHGSAYGLCQSFANERWHFELATEPGTTCPTPIPDSSYR